MEIIKTCLFGFLGGVLGGMGMGGGTILIPLVTIFLGFEQKLAQAVNLISFIPMAAVVLIVHFKNKLVKTENLFFMIIPACIFSIGGAVLCQFIKSEILSRVFGGFLIALSILQFLSAKKERKESKKIKIFQNGS